MYVPIRVLGRTVLAPPGMAARARRRKVLRPDRPPKANARSPPDQMDCFSSPAPRWLLGLRTVVLLALLVIYNDKFRRVPRGGPRGHGSCSRQQRDALTCSTRRVVGTYCRLALDSGTIVQYIGIVAPFQPESSCACHECGSANAQTGRRRRMVPQDGRLRRVARVCGLSRESGARVRSSEVLSAPVSPRTWRCAGGRRLSFWLVRRHPGGNACRSCRP